MALRLGGWFAAGAVVFLQFGTGAAITYLIGWYFDSFFITGVLLAFWTYAYFFTGWLDR